MFSPQEVPAQWEANYPYAEILRPEAMVAQGEDAVAMLPFAPAGLMDVTRISTPTHILHGTADKVVRIETHGRALVRMMPNARLTEIEGVGHMSHHVRPDLLVGALREALAPA
jgi:pimeloyl-ACP methyl ester carboxylesterase